MASNAFGNLFRITTWGESHGPAVGVIIDGCPASLAITEEEINQALARRAPGRNVYTSPRNEADQAIIESGVFNGVTTGAPIAIRIANRDAQSQPYETLKDLYRPGHANFTYLQKYNVYDYRGGGRASARETACRVAAAAIAEKLLAQQGIHIAAYLAAMGKIIAETVPEEIHALQQATWASPVFCPDPHIAEKMQSYLMQLKEQGDSIGGIVKFVVTDASAGLGDPIYEKIEANLAKAMLSLPASKGFEIGEGFAAATMRGSQHNDTFHSTEQGAQPATNHAGGLLGGITTGAPVWGRVAFKPTSSIRQPQATVDTAGNPRTFEVPATGRHDPCVAIRAVPCVAAMCALVFADAWLMARCSL